MEKRLLITGFDPFGGASVNPAWAAVAQLPEQVGEYVLCKLEIPTAFSEAAEAVLERAREFCPDAIVCVGQAGGRDAVTPERIAVNIRDARIPDNRGFRPEGARICPEGPAAYFATVPVDAMAAAIRAAGVPARVSNTAGTYVCNDVLYTLLHRFAGTDTRVGFLHVPYLPEQGDPSLPLEAIVRALTAAISAL
ncbi:MAG: pyroglutamyl-peptidase I [Firmicutes bacterium]|nr:pyroglutamyl-peptidase I [Bacillota bacterium]